jgi:hypothetical protein
MATPTNLPASFSTAQILTAAQQNGLRGAFRILQLFSVSLSTQQTTTSATYGDITGATVTITPQATTNKILVISTNSLLASSASAVAGIQILRDATSIFDSLQAYMGTDNGGSFTSMVLDSPNTTSATIYKVQLKRNSGSGLLYSNLAGSLSNLVVMEISA